MLNWSTNLHSFFFVEREFKIQVFILLTLGLGFLIPFKRDKRDLYVKRTPYYAPDMCLTF